jgi:hypothetical protein
MDLDSLKEDRKRITAPAIGTHTGGLGTRLLDDLIEQLKEADEKERRMLRRALPFWIVAAVIFTITFILAFIPGDLVLNRSTLLIRGMLMVLYVCIAVALGFKVRSIRKIDYTEPVRSFLSKAAKRQAFMSIGWSVFAFGATMLLAYAASFYIREVLERYFGIVNPVPAIAGTLVFTAGVYAFGMWATWKNWKREKEQIWLQVNEMMDELNREELNGKSESGMSSAR